MRLPEIPVVVEYNVIKVFDLYIIKCRRLASYTDV